MTTTHDFDRLEIGYDIPARPGMAEAEIQTPCLILDLDALEANIRKMGEVSRSYGLRHRAHGKMHKSVDVLRLQQELGGAIGVCCQKVSEAEVFARAGIADILVSNEIRDRAKIDRLARLPLYGGRISVCIDDAENVPDLSEAAVRHGTELHCLVEIACGARRCGVETPEAARAIAEAVGAAPGLHFAGVQAYQGPAQHLETFEMRRVALAPAFDQLRATLDLLAQAGLAAGIVTGGGTGSYVLEAESGLYTELQCGSYAFMDADYGRIRDRDGQRLDEGMWRNALFVLTSVMSHATPDRAICDAGLKSLSMESGLPRLHGRDDATYLGASDEHGTIEDPHGRLGINERLRLVPGHCDPTCNLHDWYVAVRNGQVETLWPVSARGKSY
ncbi:3-hydroxy-D-aspartate aldolase [Palleronia aestuarii]|uniref:3-hydroxy-D-aspartate aldolase n=1 Tax=Palleronia aestuarii TaxID=568105 RepID=A0A2W7NKF9_9RHOB|nr:DSD1 family PLP-dependent enzyme [Palleronia aestuarii]PZX13676.1 3-hydroxy-D-aspartate aldolase [Palleronia aestuarii]